MGLPTAPIDIANQALDQLRQPPVSDIVSGTQEVEQLLGRHYDSARQNVLERGLFKFSQKRAAISRSGTPAFDYTDAYTLPSDFVAFLSVATFEWWQTDDYVIQGLELYANASGAATLSLRYIRDETLVTKWSPICRQLVMLQLARDIAFAITGNNNDVERMQLLLDAEWKKAEGIVQRDVEPKQIRGTGATEIVNQALDLWRHPTIKSVTSPTTQLENFLATHYAASRQECLKEHIWKFAKERAQIARTSTPLFDYTDGYDMPANLVRLLSVGGEDIQDQELDYDIEGRTIQLNNSAATTLDIRYVKDETDTTLWDVGFKKILVLRIAKNIGLKIASDLGMSMQEATARMREIDKMILEWKPSLQAVDAQEVRPKRIERSKTIQARLRGVSRSNDPRYYPS